MTDHHHHHQQQKQQQQHNSFSNTRLKDSENHDKDEGDSNNNWTWLPLPTIKQQQSTSEEADGHHAEVPDNVEAVVPKPTYPRWHDAVAGALAGAGSRLVTAPLDLLRIRRQLTRETKTTSTATMTTAASTSKSTVPSSASSSSSFSASFYPRLLKQIVQTEQGGVFALFRGNLAAMYMWVAYAAVQFSIYTQSSDYLKRHFTRQNNIIMPDSTSSSSSCTLPSSLIAFVSGAAAGVCATLSTYPLDICRTTFAARGPVRLKPTATPTIPTVVTTFANASSQAPPTTMWGFATQLYQTKGWKGFYAGSGPAVIQIIPYMGFNFLIYEMVVSHLQQQQRQQQQQQQAAVNNDHHQQQQQQQQQQPPVTHSGLAGAVSGAVSKFAVYPLDTIKKRLQIQSFYTHPPWEDTSSLLLSSSSSSSSSSSLSSSANRLNPHHPHYHYTSMWDCASKMYHTEGVSSFYRGVLPSLVKSALAASLTFSIFSSTKQLLQTLDDQRYYYDSSYSS